MRIALAVASALAAAIPLTSISCTSGRHDVPDPRALTSSPLRNRVRVELAAPVAQVWALIGDFPRFPEYSSGLERVEATVDRNGSPSEFVCHFKPAQAGTTGIVHREQVRWYEPNRGYASSGADASAFGLIDDLNVVILEPTSNGGTVVTWDAYYHAHDVPAMREHYDHALSDIADRLATRFGGRIVERYVDGSED